MVVIFEEERKKKKEESPRDPFSDSIGEQRNRGKRAIDKLNDGRYASATNKGARL